MKPSYSTRWLLCWTLFVLALLTLVAGVFAFSTDWRQGLGLTLLGTGTAAPTAWWLRHASRKTRVRHITIIGWFGIMIAVGGIVLIPWKDLMAEETDQADGTHEKAPESSVEESSAPPSTDSSMTPTSTQAEGTESPSPDPAPADVEPEPTVTVTTVETMVPPLETVTEVETMVPPQVTVYYEAPVEMTPSESNNPGIGETSVLPEPSVSEPAEPTTQTESTIPTPLESGASRPQNQTTEGQ